MRYFKSGDNVQQQLQPAKVFRSLSVYSDHEDFTEDILKTDSDISGMKMLSADILCQYSFFHFYAKKLEDKKQATVFLKTKKSLKQTQNYTVELTCLPICRVMYVVELQRFVDTSISCQLLN